MSQKVRISIEIDAPSQEVLNKIVSGMPGVAPSYSGDMTTQELRALPEGWVRSHVTIYKTFEKLALAHVEGNHGSAYVRSILNFLK